MFHSLSHLVSSDIMHHGLEMSNGIRKISIGWGNSMLPITWQSIAWTNGPSMGYYSVATIKLNAPSNRKTILRIIFLSVFFYMLLRSLALTQEDSSFTMCLKPQCMGQRNPLQSIIFCVYQNYVYQNSSTYHDWMKSCNIQRSIVSKLSTRLSTS